MENVQLAEKSLKELITLDQKRATMFFKTGKGEYSEHDVFLGVSIPNIRKVAKQYASLSLSAVGEILNSIYHEMRLLGAIILVNKMQKAKEDEQKEIFEFYLSKKDRLNNWDIIDVSAHLIVGVYLLDKDKTILFDLAQSNSLWDRRIAVVATWFFIRKGHLDTTYALCKELLEDKEDLMHKACGWMLREAGKKDQESLTTFIHTYGKKMARTALRYAIEKYTKEERAVFLAETK